MLSQKAKKRKKKRKKKRHWKGYLRCSDNTRSKSVDPLGSLGFIVLDSQFFALDTFSGYRSITILCCNSGSF